MDIREYMFRKNLKVNDLAAMLGCSRGQIDHLRAGKKVSLWFAKTVELCTGGEVTIEEIRHSDINEKRKNKEGKAA